jgi:hypothetical protein
MDAGVGGIWGLALLITMGLRCGFDGAWRSAVVGQGPAARPSYNSACAAIAA